MFRTIDDFEKSWNDETKATQRTLGAMTDASLAQPVESDHRTLGRIAWHMTDTVKMNVLMRQAGLSCPGIYGPSKQEWAQWGMQPPAT